MRQNPKYSVTQLPLSTSTLLAIANTPIQSIDSSGPIRAIYDSKHLAFRLRTPLKFLGMIGKEWGKCLRT